MQDYQRQDADLLIGSINAELRTSALIAITAQRQRERWRFSLLNHQNSGQKKPLQSSPRQSKSSVGCCCRTTSNGRKVGRQVPVSRISSKPLQPRVKTREGDLDWLSDNEVDIGEPFRVWRDIAVCWSGGEDLIIIISLWKRPCAVDLRWKTGQN